MNVHERSLSQAARDEVVEVLRALSPETPAWLPFLLLIGGRPKQHLYELTTGHPGVLYYLEALLQEAGWAFSRQDFSDRRFRLDIELPAERQSDLQPLALSFWRRTSEDARMVRLAALYALCGALTEQAGELSYRLYHPVMAARFKAEASALDLGLRIHTERRGVRLYTKAGEKIAELLLLSGASRTYLRVTTLRVERELTNMVNRQVNCDAANARRLADSAAAQIAAIQRIEETVGLQALPETLAETARIRLLHPDLTLAEFGALLQPPIGKSGVNHRLTRLLRFAEELEKDN